MILIILLVQVQVRTNLICTSNRVVNAIRIRYERSTGSEVRVVLVHYPQSAKQQKTIRLLLLPGTCTSKTILHFFLWSW